MQLVSNKFIMDFSSDAVGYDTLKLPQSYYYDGHLYSTSQNRIESNGDWVLSSSDYYILLIEGVEYSVGGLDWTTKQTTEKSINLYGRYDTVKSDSVVVIKSTTTEILNISGGRSVIRQEVWYYLSPSGDSALKKVKIWLNIDTAGTIKTIKILQFSGFNPAVTKVGHQRHYFGKVLVGFNYETISDYSADWQTDSPLTVTIARKSPAPNMLPPFTSSDWKDRGEVVSGSRMKQKNGDFSWLSVYNPFPDDRDIYFQFEVEDITGNLEVGFSVVRNVSNTLTDNFQFLIVTANGSQILKVPKGFGKQWLYVSFKAVDGGCVIVEPSVNYRGSEFTYVAPDGSDLANLNLRNCVRLTSTAPQGKYLQKNLTENLYVADGGGVGIAVRSLDNTHITTGAFQIELRKPDGSWVVTDQLNMFVDWNEKWKESASQFNVWDDSLFGVPVPTGVNEISGVRLRIITAETIDWLLDDFFVIDWVEKDFSEGLDDRRNFGPSVEGIRAREFCLGGVAGAVSHTDVEIKGEKIKVSPGGYYNLSFHNVDSIDRLYYLGSATGIFQASDFTDYGYKMSHVLSSLSGLVYPVSVTNLTSGEGLKIISWDFPTRTIEINVENKQRNPSDVFVVEYATELIIDPSYYTMELFRINWDSSISDLTDILGIYAYAQYRIVKNSTTPIGLALIGTRSESNTVRFLSPDIKMSSPLLSLYVNGVLSDSGNSYTEALFGISPTKSSGRTLYATLTERQEELDRYQLSSRVSTFFPTPVNYNLIPHIAFGGEQIAAEPVQYLRTASEKMSIAGTANAIFSAGSLSYLRDRDLDTGFWYWGGSLLDTGIDYLQSGRNMLRSGKTEEQVRDEISRYRYLFEVTTFAYEHNKRYPDHASTDYKGVQKFRRVWYYQATDGLYTAIVRNWGDFDDSYYEDVVLTSGVYVFQYHYTLIIPAFWSIVEPKTTFGLTENTVYDLMKIRLNWLCSNYDCDGVIISELIHYREGFSDNDFILYNTWCQANGYGFQTDWPRFHENNYVDPDDRKVWDWKRYQVKKYLTGIASFVHSKGKLLGVNVLAQNIFSVTNVNADAWNGYETTFNPDYQSWHVNMLEDSLDRYGTNYEEILKENIVDLLYVWLYYSYSPYGQQTILDFIAKFDKYKERMILTIGLFPKEDPPKKCEIVHLIRTLLSAGWNVAYAGYPPMMIQSAEWEDVWPKLSGWVPSATVNAAGDIVVDPAKAVSMPFLFRF